MDSNGQSLAYVYGLDNARDAAIAKALTLDEARPIASDIHFPAPWTVEKIAGGFKVIDANGQSLAYVYSSENPNDAFMRKVLTLDEARRIASNIAKLPDLLGKVRPDDNIQAVGNLSDERHEAEDTTPE